MFSTTGKIELLFKLSKLRLWRVWAYIDHPHAKDSILIELRVKK